MLGCSAGALWLVVGLLAEGAYEEPVRLCAQKEAVNVSQALSARVEVKRRSQGAIHLRLRVTNESGRRLVLTLSGRPAHNFLVTRADGTLVWEWLRGQVVQQILQQKTLEPGAELIFDATWPLVDVRGRRVSAGEYWVQGVLNLEPPQRLSTDPVPVRVPSRKRLPSR